MSALGLLKVFYENHTQAKITSFLIDVIIGRVSENIDVEAALVEYKSEINEEQFSR